MDSTVKDIYFDSDGICDYCKNYLIQIKNEQISNKVESFDKLITQIKNEGINKEHDCIIGISGGVDSSYVAYLVKNCGLRPLAVHLDNGWNSELAISNIEKILNALNIDLYTHVIDWEEFKDLQKSFISSSINNLELPTDHAINALLLKIANQHNIRFVLNGSNLATEGILPISWMGRSIDYRLLKSIHNKFGTKKLVTFPSLSLRKFAYLLLIKKVKFIPILNYVDFNKEEAIQFLEKRFDWKRYGGKHYESIFTRFFQGYILPVKYQIDKRIAHLSTLIMSGQISREEALNELKNMPYSDEKLMHEDKDYVLKKLSYSEEEFVEIMSQKPVKTNYYRSSDYWFDRLSFLMYKFKDLSKKI
jgi:N-acetyl sugar amidotransferase